MCQIRKLLSMIDYNLVLIDGIWRIFYVARQILTS